jgi:hypothetical protein
MLHQEPSTQHLISHGTLWPFGDMFNRPEDKRKEDKRKGKKKKEKKE